jgi:hypothetical protein
LEGLGLETFVIFYGHLIYLWEGLPVCQNSNLGFILECIGLDNVGLFCGRFEYFTDIWYTLWPIGIVIWYRFSAFWYVGKSGNPVYEHLVYFVFFW